MLDPEIEEVLDALAPAEVVPAYQPGEVPFGYDWADQWRDEPVGRCVYVDPDGQRCPWPAWTPGPDGRPWHPFCWVFAGYRISPWERWYYRQATSDQPPRPAAELEAVEGPEQWCAHNRRRFVAAGAMAGACDLCRVQVEVEQDPADELARAKVAALVRERLGR